MSWLVILFYLRQTSALLCSLALSSWLHVHQVVAVCCYCMLASFIYIWFSWIVLLLFYLQQAPSATLLQSFYASAITCGTLGWATLTPRCRSPGLPTIHPLWIWAEFLSDHLQDSQLLDPPPPWSASHHPSRNPVQTPNHIVLAITTAITPFFSEKSGLDPNNLTFTPYDIFHSWANRCHSIPLTPNAE